MMETQALLNHPLVLSSWGRRQSYTENVVYRHLYLETNAYVTELNCLS